MSKNKYISTLTNGLFKENPTFVHDARYVSDAGGYHIGNQRPRHGTFHDSGHSDAVQLFHLDCFEKRDSG